MILGAIMVPHPPIIIPEIGKGEEQAIQPTIDAYHQAAKTLASWKPDTILFLSPHADMYRDYFQISPGSHAKGSFARFQAPDVSFDVTYDTELVDAICSISQQEGMPAGKEYPEQESLDHGVMVPLYFIEQYIQDVPIVRIGLSGLSLEKHRTFGQLIARACDQLGRRVAVVASGDLSHYCQERGPYGFREQGPKYDERIMEVMGAGDFDALLDFDESFLAAAGECGHRSFTILSGILDGLQVHTQRLSHQDVFGVGYGICIYTCQDPYVSLAKETIEAFIQGESLPIVPESLSYQQAGTFVSLHKNGQLRGCIGTFLPTQECVGLEVISNAIKACSQDPRFPAVQSEEIGELDISVDVLGSLEPVEDKRELDVHRYGILVSDPYGRRGLLLPDLEGVDTVDQQIEIAMMKAGITEEDSLEIQRFEVVRHQ